MLLLSLLLAVQTPIDSVQIVTRDIPNFWRAYDLAAGKDSAERVRIFRARVVAEPALQRPDDTKPQSSCWDMWEDVV